MIPLTVDVEFRLLNQRCLNALPDQDYGDLTEIERELCWATLTTKVEGRNFFSTLVHGPRWIALGNDKRFPDAAFQEKVASILKRWTVDERYTVPVTVDVEKCIELESAASKK